MLVLEYFYCASTDAPPTNENVYDGYNDYDAEAGFQNDFSANFRNALLSTSLIVVKANADGDGTETVVDKVFLLSTTEVGLADEDYAEGSKLALFSDNVSRQAYPTALCVNSSEYTDADLRQILLGAGDCVPRRSSSYPVPALTPMASTPTLARHQRH